MEVVEVDRAERLRARGDGDDPGSLLRTHPVDEEAREQERREVVERERQLEAVRGDVAVRPEPAHVVDQHVDSGVALLQFGGQSAHLRLRRQVGLEDVDRVIARPAAELVGGGGQPVPASRPTMPTRAPRAASPAAVAFPIPPVAPVTTTFRPDRGCDAFIGPPAPAQRPTHDDRNAADLTRSQVSSRIGRAASPGGRMCAPRHPLARPLPYIVSRMPTSCSNVVVGFTIAKRVFGRPACELGVTNARCSSSRRADHAL